MIFAPPPPTAGWRHHADRPAFEVASFHPRNDGWHIEGRTTAAPEVAAWEMRYVIDVDLGWTTRHASIELRSAAERRSVVLDAVGPGRWRLDGDLSPSLDGCLDVDLEASAMTNAFPIHRLDLAVGQRADAPAAYVRSDALAVERLEQTYTRVTGHQARARYLYAAPRFGFMCVVVYDEAGLVLNYPGIAVRSDAPPGRPRRR